MNAKEIFETHIGKEVDIERYTPILEEYYRAGKIIVIGPTGSGKTTISKLMFLNDAEKHRYRKLFYLLPTQSLVNAKYQDFKNFATLIPGRPKVSLLSAFSDEKDWFNPLIISTYDFYYLVRTFQIKYLGRSRQTAAPLGHTVYDELHTFEPSQIARLTALAEVYGNTIITTATLHPVLRKRIEEKLGVRTVYLEPFSAHDRVNHIEYVDTENKIDDIVELYKGHKKERNLVVLNTVGEALEAFKRITGEEDTTKILSEGIIGDAAFLTSATSVGARQKIEEIIEYGKIKTIVATQVAEVGLNYDPDLLITDAAPSDALIQRIGRIRTKGKVFVVKNVQNDGTKAYCGVYDMEVVERTFTEFQQENINDVLVSNSVAEAMLEKTYRPSISKIIEVFENKLLQAENSMKLLMKSMKDVSEPFRDNQRYVYFFDARNKDTASFNRLYRASFEVDRKNIKNKNFVYKYFFEKIYEDRDRVYFMTLAEFKKAVKNGETIFNREYGVGNFYKIIRSAPEQYVIILADNADIL